jgi:hypothetical protein
VMQQCQLQLAMLLAARRWHVLHGPGVCVQSVEDNSGALVCARDESAV